MAPIREPAVRFMRATSRETFRDLSHATYLRLKVDRAIARKSDISLPLQTRRDAAAHILSREIR